MVKILIISPYIPFPLNAGGNVAQFAVLERLQHQMDVTLYVQVLSDKQFEDVEQLRQRLPQVDIRFTDLRESPGNQPTMSFKSWVAQQLRRLLRSFNPRTQEAPVGYYDEFTVGYHTMPFQLKHPRFLTDLQLLFEATHFDIVQTEYHEFIDLVEILPASAKKVFVMVESRSFRLQSAFAGSPSPQAFKQYVLSVNRLVENSFLHRYDAVITFSHDDKTRLSDTGILTAHNIPYPIPDDEFRPDAYYKSVKKLVFLGGDGHSPNREGLTWFIEQCYPHILKAHNLPLLVVGSWRKQSFDSVPGVHMMGFVQNLDEVLEDAVMVVPIRIGNGIRTKILYGMAKNIPIISTTLGCEGLPVNNGSELLMADTPDDFYECISRLITSPADARLMANAAFDFVDKNYRQDVVVRKRKRLYMDLLKKHSSQLVAAEN